jgi:hypothetical protein
MKAGWHGHPISDGSHDGPTCACAHQSILVFQGRPPSAGQRFVNLVLSLDSVYESATKWRWSLADQVGRESPEARDSSATPP